MRTFISIVTLATCLGFPPVQAQQQQNQSGMLFGRVDDFLVPGGPQFPKSYREDGSADVESTAEAPQKISGLWHGELEVIEGRTTDDCAKWNPDFTSNWNMIYQKSRKGQAQYDFEKKGARVGMTKGMCVFSVPLKESKVSYNEIITNLSNPTPEQIAIVDRAIANLNIPIMVHQGNHSRNSEVLGNGITTRMIKESVLWKKLSDNIWEADEISKRMVTFPAPRPSEIMYTEGVTRITRKSNDELFYETAQARFSQDRAPLCYSVASGILNKGTGTLPEDVSDVDVNLIPVKLGVQLRASGGTDPQAAVTVLIPDATMRKK